MVMSYDSCYCKQSSEGDGVKDTAFNPEAGREIMPETKTMVMMTLVLSREWGGRIFGDYYWGLYRDCYRDPFPRSLLSTRQTMMMTTPKPKLEGVLYVWAALRAWRALRIGNPKL